MNFSPPHSRQRAFKLVEVLVVIAIIAMLAAIAIPSFRAAQLSASRAESATNLKNFGAVTYSHVADNNGSLPGPSNGSDRSRISPIASSGSANGLGV